MSIIFKYHGSYWSHCMGRYDPRGSRYAATVDLPHGERAEVYGKMSGRKSLCMGSGLKRGSRNSEC